MSLWMADSVQHHPAERSGTDPRSASSGALGAARPRILVVEDDDAVREELADMLDCYGMEARRVADWQSAIDILRTTRIDLIILDQWLGSVDTLTRLPDLRALTPAYIVMITANRAEADRIVGLEGGADDFLQKPISGREIVARVRAHLRRAAPAAVHPAPDLPQGGGGTWRIFRGLRRVCAPDGEPVPLTSTEYELLVLLMSSPGRPVDRETLSRAVLQRSYRSEDRALDNLVHNIRVKLGGRHGENVIATVRNRGYAFTGLPAEREP